jgi:N-acetyl-anhydromuramyl-L-alanine amidase AmpD
VAEYRVDTQGWPGIGYHYFITHDGLIQQTNELTTQSTHAGQYDPVAIGICFAGNFTNEVPTSAQIEAGAQLIAWLLPQFGLTLAAVSGYKELVVTQSPGLQWDSGARWGDQLKVRVQAYLQR